MRSVECHSVECGMGSMEYGVWSMELGVSSVQAVLTIALCNFTKSCGCHTIGIENKRNITRSCAKTESTNCKHTSVPNIAPATKSGIPLIREVHQISELWCLQRRHLITMYYTRHDICTLSPVDTTVPIT